MKQIHISDLTKGDYIMLYNVDMTLDTPREVMHRSAYLGRIIDDNVYFNPIAYFNDGCGLTYYSTLVVHTEAYPVFGTDIIYKLTTTEAVLYSGFN